MALLQRIHAEINHYQNANAQTAARARIDQSVFMMNVRSPVR